MAVSDSEESIRVSSKAKATPSQEGEEEEYEIEEVLDAKRGFFPDGRMGYFVKWKGYGPEDNSWVDEQDAENAQELVNEFWKKNPQKKKAITAARKSVDKKSPKKPRKSTVADDTSEAGEASTKKRGRKSLSHKVESDDEMDVDEEEKPAKKAKKESTQPSKTNARKLKTDSPEEEEVHLGTMKRYMNLPSWEGLVKTIDTVERADDDALKIFFTLNNGERVTETAAICKQRFPQKLLEFYETNLKWRQVGGDL
ncbi:hypothetical protein CPB84DRAFT_1902908 [Gymnopilus junonius]|uniref:Chromo domain-containing protein n=1 Tax=Gymnopilus junonius TaxID=109634 RepID=A0A9P5TQH0_GYMJU|nr:hypothetical protein CPB84DRAFT_1902908 [Gymnopilus junonius]